MQKYLEKYADVLLNKCLKVKKEDPLFIQAPMERYDFVRILTKKAYEMGIKDIHLRLMDEYVKHEQLKNLSIEELKKISWWQGTSLSEYAKNGAAILNLKSEYPELMSDIDSNKLLEIDQSMTKEAQGYYERTKKNEIAWCIAAVPSKDWADKLFPNEEDSVNKLWNTIFDICHITDEDPSKSIDEKIKRSKKRADNLNELNIKYLKYTNSLGTDLTLELPEDYVFHNVEMHLQDGRVTLPNMPSEEIYSSPKKDGTNGIVYSSKPLIHSGKFIDKFYLEFKDGKVINFKAEEGEEDLANIINFDENSLYLGEVALVDYDSPISNTNLLFYNTLFDENASCHLALGQSFSDCVVDGENKEEKELEEIGLNQSKTHVDFMIGTDDLNIIAITNDNKEIEIFKNGNFII